MSTVDPIVQKALELLSPEPTRLPDWSDILVRSRENGHLPVRLVEHPGRLVEASRRPPRTGRRARRVLVMSATLAVLLIVVFATPAFGLRARIIALFEDGPPAPATVEMAFSDLDRGAPAGMATGVISTQGREVSRTPLPDGSELVLYVAPTGPGGFCSLATIEPHDGGPATGGTGLSCRTREDLRSRPLATSVSIPGPISADGQIQGPVLIDGSVAIASVVTLDLEFEDGTSRDVPLARISEPIGAAFFALALPTANQEPGHRPAALVGRDENGNEIVRDEGTLKAAFPVRTP